jgi:hypothetical protein
MARHFKLFRLESEGIGIQPPLVEGLSRTNCTEDLFSVVSKWPLMTNVIEGLFEKTRHETVSSKNEKERAA